MGKTMTTLLAIVLVGLFPAMAILQHNADRYTQEGAVHVAERYLRNMPTFSFDGIEDTVEVIGVETLRTPNTWGVSIGFTSRNGGYGDRAGQMVITALQDHITWIVVNNGKVIEAITDGVFDEINEEHINQDTDEAEEAKQLALEFLRNAPTFCFDGIEGTMEVVDTLIAESYPVQYFISVKFDCSQPGYGDRTGLVLAQVITEHEVRVVVVNGEVTSAIIDGVWDELIQQEKVSSELHPPESVVYAALDYVKGNYPVVSDVEIPEDWSVSNMNPDDLVGAMKIGYNGGGWDITVSWAVVLEPVYLVNMSYGEYAWTFEVDQMLNVVETTG